MKKQLLALSFFLTIAAILNGQTVSNVWAEVKNARILVHYTLNTHKATDVELYYSDKSGYTWQQCNSISGNVQQQTSGSKTIVWDCLFDGVLQGDFLFQVHAGLVAPERQKFVKPTDGPANAWLSLLVPGLGDHRVTKGQKKGVYTALLTYACIGAGVYCKIGANDEYAQYHAATEQTVMDEHYDNAKYLNGWFYTCVGVGAAIWVYDIIWVWNKGAQNKKAWDRQPRLGFYYEPNLKAPGLTYTYKF